MGSSVSRVAEDMFVFAHISGDVNGTFNFVILGSTTGTAGTGFPVSQPLRFLRVRQELNVTSFAPPPPSDPTLTLTVSRNGFADVLLTTSKAIKAFGHTASQSVGTAVAVPGDEIFVVWSLSGNSASLKDANVFVEAEYV